MSEASEQPPTPKPNTTRRLQSTGCGIVIGATIGLVILLGMWIAMVRDPLPQLTPDAFIAAKQLWDKNGPSSYDLEFTTSGDQTGNYAVKVRSGKVVRVLRDGVAVADRGEAWNARSIPGLFLTIDEESRLAKNPQKAFGVTDASSIKQQALFDQEFGFPRRYRRIILGANRQIEWKVNRFEVVP